MITLIKASSDAGLLPDHLYGMPLPKLEDGITTILPSQWI